MGKEKKLKVNILLKILLIILFVFVFYIIFSYAKNVFKNRENIYQVEVGSLKRAENYRGYIFRDEVVFSAPKDGFCSLIYQNISRVPKDSIIMIFTDIDYSNIEKENVTDTHNAYNKVLDYARLYDDNDFYAIYSYKNNIRHSMEDMNNNIYTYVDSMAYKDANAIKIYSRDSGILTYGIDNMEEKKLEDYRDSFLLSKDYYQSSIKPFYNKDEKVCKIVTSPSYHIVFDTDSEIIKNYVNRRINIELKGENNQVECLLSTYTSNDEKEHYVLTLDKYLEEFINYRVVDFSIVYEENQGLKIPNACIYNKNCFVIDKDFVELNELDNNYYIYKLDAKNNKKQYQIDISYSDDKNYYIICDENKDLMINDKIVYNNKTFTITNIKAFEGVYCINKGYRSFKIINVLDKNTEYSIIKREYGSSIKEYDILVLNVDI